jgi:hypothetical protein
MILPLEFESALSAARVDRSMAINGSRFFQSEHYEEGMYR